MRGAFELGDIPSFAIHKSRPEGVDTILDVHSKEQWLDLHYLAVTELEKQLPDSEFLSRLETSIQEVDGYLSGMKLPSEQYGDFQYDPTKSLFLFVYNRPGVAAINPREGQHFSAGADEGGEDRITFDVGAGLFSEFFDLIQVGFDQHDVDEINREWNALKARAAREGSTPTYRPQVFTKPVEEMAIKVIESLQEYTTTKREAA